MIIPEGVERRLLSDVLTAYSDLPPDMKRASDLAFARENPAKFLFHVFGLEFLVKKGAIRKVGKDRYILSRIPKRIEKVRDKRGRVIKTRVNTNFWATIAFHMSARGKEAKKAGTDQ